MTQKAYLFMDEGGDFDFTHKGSRYFSLTSLVMTRPFDVYLPMNEYRYDCIEYGIGQEYFHCAADNRHVRKNVFDRLLPFTHALSAHCLMLDKRAPFKQKPDPYDFYAKMLTECVISALNNLNILEVGELYIITDTLPLQSKRRVVEKNIKKLLAHKIPVGLHYKVLHHASRAHFGLQIADYINWAVMRKWEREDADHYQNIVDVLRTERVYAL